MRVLIFLGALALSSAVAVAAMLGGGVVHADPAGRLAPQTAAVAPAATTTAAEIEVMPLEEAVALVTAMSPEHAVQVFDELSAAKAAEMMGEMGVAKASEIWGDMKPASAGLVMEDVPTVTAIGIVELVSEERLVARLPEISPQKLWEMPVGLLLDKLPSVDAMHLNIWTRPQVAPDLPPPTSSQPTEDRSVYTVPETRSSEWALMVASPAPFDKVWAKFTRPLTNVRFVVDNLGSARPAAAPDLPPGLIANSFLRIAVENAALEDISAAAAIAFVDKSWLEANQVHKWSIQFSRLDEDLNIWVPSPSKRIREDDERLFFAVAVPGFSTIAITGSARLQPRTLVVADLVIAPDSPEAGGRIEISANVTNTGSDRAVYPAVLWVEGAIEAVRTVTVDPGQTAPVAFTITRPRGQYSVRVDRSLGALTVGHADARLPDSGGIAPGPALLVALGVVGLLTALAGGFVAGRSRSHVRRGG